MPRIKASSANVPRPVVKWAGGKSKLAARLAARMPSEIRTYVEPFCGGAALFFHLAGEGNRRFERAVLTDMNEHLIGCYRAIKANVDQLIERLQELATKYERLDHEGRQRLFYKMRDETIPKSDLDRGVRLLFLNKTCFNGLWRENAAGKNNVPFGRYERPRILDVHALKAASRALQVAKIHRCDYAEATKGLGAKDFVYFDPPYVPVSKTANFTSYAKDGFTWDDQRRLRKLLDDLAKRRVRAMLSNARTAETEALYEGLFCDVVPMARAINSDAKKRGEVDELVVCNFVPEAMSKAS